MLEWRGFDAFTTPQSDTVFANNCIIPQFLNFSNRYLIKYITFQTNLQRLAEFLTAIKYTNFCISTDNVKSLFANFKVPIPSYKRKCFDENALLN